MRTTYLAKKLTFARAGPITRESSTPTPNSPGARGSDEIKIAR